MNLVQGPSVLTKTIFLALYLQMKGGARQHVHKICVFIYFHIWPLQDLEMMHSEGPDILKKSNGKNTPKPSEYHALLEQRFS